MKLFLPTLVAPLALSTFTSASQSFAGSSLYFLHGLSDADQDNYINTLASYKAKVIRLWVTSIGKGCQKGSNIPNSVPDFEYTIGDYNWNTLAALDKVLAKMAAKGMKAIISPHDGNNIHGSDRSQPTDVYENTYGTGFYTNSKAEAQYDARLKAILTYVSPSSGKEWGNWSEAILAFDIQNEPFQFDKNGVNTDPSGWLCGRAQTMKSYLTGSNIKVATGGVGGDQSWGATMATTALQCPHIDLMSVHAYVGTASFWQSAVSGWISAAKQNGKLAYVEEWGVAKGDSSDFNEQAAAINSEGIPFVYWQFIPGLDQTETCDGGCCSSGGYDGFEIGLNSGKGNAQAALEAAAGENTVQDWSFAFGSSTTTPPTPPSPPTNPGGSWPADTCTWGCEGWDCSSSSPCQSAYSCQGGYCSDCTWGCNGWDCSTSSPCNADYTCVSGYCHHSGPATK